MPDSVWIVGQSLGVEGEEVLWRKIGTFVDLALAESWMAYTKADILLEQTQHGASVLPTFSQVAVSVFPPSLACNCHEHGICTCRKQEGGACH